MSLLLSCVLSTHNKRILYCIIVLISISVTYLIGHNHIRRMISRLRTWGEGVSAPTLILSHLAAFPVLPVLVKSWSLHCLLTLNFWMSTKPTALCPYTCMGQGCLWGSACPFSLIISLGKNIYHVPHSCTFLEILAVQRGSQKQLWVKDEAIDTEIF